MEGFDSTSFDERIAQAQAEAERKRRTAGIMEGVSDMFTSGSQARGGPGTDSSFYRGLRDNAGIGAREAQVSKRDAIKDYLLEKKFGRQAEQDQRQIEQDAARSDRWQQSFDLRKDRPGKAPFDFKLTPDGRIMIGDKRTGEYSFKGGRPQDGAEQELGPQQRPGESKMVYKGRVDEYIKDKKDAGRTKEDKVKGLSGEQIKRYDSASMGLDAAKGMIKALGEGDNTFSIVGDNDYTMWRSRWNEAFGRMQSGGAIQSAELETFEKMVPTMYDSKEIQMKKLGWVENEMNRRISNLLGGEQQPTDKPMEPGAGIDKPSWAK